MCQAISYQTNATISTHYQYFAFQCPDETDIFVAFLCKENEFVALLCLTGFGEGDLALELALAKQKAFLYF
jgi:hypothetical protein